MEEEALGFTRALAGTDTQLTGLLRVSSSDWFGIHVLTPLFARFLAKHRGVSIELVTDSRRYNLARREADLVFRITPFDEPGVIQRKLMHMGYALYGPIDLVAPRAGDGEGHTLISMDSAFGTLPDVAWVKRMLPNARIAFSSNNRGAQARMCAEGGGFAVLPCPLGDATPGLRRIDLGEAPPGRDVWFGYHRDLRRLAPACAARHDDRGAGKRVGAACVEKPDIRYIERCPVTSIPTPEQRWQHEPLTHRMRRRASRSTPSLASRSWNSAPTGAVTARAHSLRSGTRSINTPTYGI
jgi:DNA-binding transcriptional LysR family regulator